MNQNKTFIKYISLSIFLLSPLAVNAVTVITPIDEDSLRVVKYQGKPPHKRLVVNKNSEPALYQHYSDLMTVSNTDSTKSNENGRNWKGAPGKH